MTEANPTIEYESANTPPAPRRTLPRVLLWVIGIIVMYRMVNFRV